MATKAPLSHYSPVFSNQPWADNDGYISYYKSPYKNNIIKSTKGRKQWGRQRGLYTWAVENALNIELENEAAILYNKILKFDELTSEERFIWSQFILSQLIRTPTFIHYENYITSKFNITELPTHDRVGCKECLDLKLIANRDWCLLIAHEDDYFVRTDNPILQTGFIERPESCLFYPLTPRVCFVACSMTKNSKTFKHQANETIGYVLSKGAAHQINFYLAKSAKESLIISPKHDGLIADTMFLDILGIYPQPPFSLHSPTKIEFDDAFKSIQSIMSNADLKQYCPWEVSEIEPFYQPKN